MTKNVFSSKLVKSQAEILELIYKLKRSEYRGEQAEMNIQRLNVRIDQVCNLLLVFIFLVCLFCNVKIRDVPAFLLSQVCFNDLQIRWRRICSARSTRSKSEFQKFKFPYSRKSSHQFSSALLSSQLSCQRFNSFSHHRHKLI